MLARQTSLTFLSPFITTQRDFDTKHMMVKLFFFETCFVILFIIYIFALSKITHITE